MNRIANDWQIFGDMKAVFGKFGRKLGLQITGEGQADNYLFFNSRLFHPTENDLAIGYQTKAKTIRITARIFLPIPMNKRKDMLELFNYLNDRLENVRLNIDSTTQLIQLRGEMALFGRPLDQNNFDDVLTLFFAALTKLFPMIGDYFIGKIKREDIQNEIDAEIKAQQGTK